MEAKERSYVAYGLLDEVLRKGAYSSIELNKKLNALDDERDKAFVTRLFYGVLSKNTQLEYILSRLTTKRPKPAPTLAIKMGAYMLLYMDVPDYAVINTQVDLVKRLGKKEVSGFVNAVLRKVKTVTLPLKSGNKIKDISVNYSCPEWIVKLLVKDYGADFTTAYLSAKLPEKTHIRANLNVISDDEFKKKYPQLEQSTYGLYASKNELNKIPSKEYIIQSLSSCYAVRYFASGLTSDDSVLDLCSAPGGKAVQLRQLTGASVLACDIHPHRVELIKAYAKKTGTTLQTAVNDATAVNNEWIEKFDSVICDVPCSGLGVIFSKPDIMLSRSSEDISALSEMQLSILSTASKYVKKGGTLCYSTCTVTKKENEGVIKAFLAKNSNFSVETAQIENASADENGYLKLYPQTHGCDGFFVVKLRRNE